MRLLILAERPLAETIETGLSLDGISFDQTDTFARASGKLMTREYEAVLAQQEKLLSDASLLRWRSEGVKAHLVVLLPRGGGPSARAACLDAGADACLNQPLNLDELRAHLRALRRREQQPQAPVWRVHDLEINTAVRSVRRAGRKIHLTPREFELLQLLAAQPGKVLSRSMILERLYDDHEGSYSNVVDVYVRYLRNKIDKGFDTPLILTRWGEGYLLRAEGA